MSANGDRGARDRRAALLYVLVAGALLVAAQWADRYPINWLTGGLALVAPPLGAGMLARSYAVIAVAPLPLFGGFLLVLTDVENPFGLLVFGATLTVAALVLMPLGVLAARRRRPRAPVAAALALAGLLVVPVAVAERHRTVRADRDRPVAVDLRAGTYAGVGLGDTRAEIEDRLGKGEHLDPDDPARRGVGDDVTTGPATMATTGDELRYGDRVAFMLDDDGRAEFVMIADRQAQTGAGLGPGDSLELFTDAHPELRCEEGSLGSDHAIPYPSCAGRVTDLWLYVGGTYERAGMPAAVLVLSEGRVGP